MSTQANALSDSDLDAILGGHQASTVSDSDLDAILKPKPIPGMERLGPLPGVPKPRTPGLDEPTADDLAQPGGFQNPRTGRRSTVASDLKRYPVLDAPAVGGEQAWEGVEQMAGPGLRAKAGGVSKILRGTMKMSEPIMAAGAIVNPVGTAVTLGAGMGAGMGTEAGLKALGVPDEYSEFGGDVAGLLGGGLAGKAVHGAAPSEHPLIKASRESQARAALDPAVQKIRAEAAVRGQAITPPTAQEGAEQFAKEEPAHNAYAKLFDEIDRRNALRNQAERRASITPPEEGILENVARATDARDQIAHELSGKPFAELSNPDRIAVDDLVRERLYGKGGSRQLADDEIDQILKPATPEVPRDTIESRPADNIVSDQTGPIEAPSGQQTEAVQEQPPSGEAQVAPTPQPAPPASPLPPEAASGSPAPPSPAVEVSPVAAVEPSPTTKPSKLALGVEEKAIANSLSTGFEGRPEYQTVNVADQAAKAADLLKNDRDMAVKIAMGHELPPAGLLPESVFVAVENHATATKDVNLLRDLATTSTLSMEATGMGQRIRMLAERDPESAVASIKKVSEAREKSAVSKYGPNAKEQIKQQIRVEIKRASPTKSDWSRFLESIECS